MTVILYFNKRNFIDGVALAHSIAEATGIDVKMDTNLRPDYVTSYDTITDLEETRQRTEGEISRLETALKVATAMA
jgi:hypothetical protein